MTPPSWVRNDIGVPANLIHQLGTFFDELGGGDERLVMDLNFRDGDDPTYAINEIKYLTSQLGPQRWRHVKALEIGNECDLYGYVMMLISFVLFRTNPYLRHARS